MIVSTGFVSVTASQVEATTLDVGQPSTVHPLHYSLCSQWIRSLTVSKVMLSLGTTCFSTTMEDALATTAPGTQYSFPRSASDAPLFTLQSHSFFAILPTTSTSHHTPV